MRRNVTIGATNRGVAAGTPSALIEGMSAAYNEIEPFAAQWLRNLSAAGHIATGAINEQSIEDLRADDVRDAVQFHAFAGIGVWSHALRLAGWPDDRPVWTGSCPCQPFSTAGRRKGAADTRHLWPAWFYLIRKCRPPVLFGEQVASPDGRLWLRAVQADLETLGYSVAGADLCAAGVGAPHIRQRLFWGAIRLGDTDHARLEGHAGNEDNSNQPGRIEEKATRSTRETNSSGFWSPADWLPCSDGKARPVEPGTFPLAHGTPNRVGRLRAYGNAIVPQVAAAFITSFMETIR